VIVRSAPDERIQRDGADLWHVLSIVIADSMLGMDIEVPMLNGSPTAPSPARRAKEAPLRYRFVDAPAVDRRPP
jgi:DnaJ-class molecular chaperone